MLKRNNKGQFVKGDLVLVARNKSLRQRLAVSEANLGDKNGMWKGNMVGYIALHEWVKNRIPKPKYCKNCKINSPYDLANISQKYLRNLEDWEWLCRSCHMKKDGRMRNLKYQRNYVL